MTIFKRRKKKESKKVISGIEKKSPSFHALFFLSKLHPLANAVLVLQENLLGDLLQASRAGGDEAQHGGRGLEDLALVLWVVLDAHEPGVVLELDHLHAVARVVLADEVQARALELLHVVGVHLVAVSVALVDNVCVAVQGSELAPFAAGLEVRGSRSLYIKSAAG